MYVTARPCPEKAFPGKTEELAVGCPAPGGADHGDQPYRRTGEFRDPGSSGGTCLAAPGPVAAGGHLPQRGGRLVPGLARGWNPPLVSLPGPAGDRQAVLRSGHAQRRHERHRLFHRGPESPRGSQPCVHGHAPVEPGGLLWGLSAGRPGDPAAAVFPPCDSCLDRAGGRCLFAGRGRHPGRCAVGARPGAKGTCHLCSHAFPE